MIELNETTFDELISGDTFVVVDFFATWCRPCVNLMKVLPRLEDQYEDDEVKFGSVDVDQVPALAERYEISSVPTFIMFRNGEIIDRWSGVKSLMEMRVIIDGLLQITREGDRE